MSYQLFEIKDGDIVIKKVEILTVPSFTKIFRRDKGSEGDYDGRKKLQAFKEFAYIYHIADSKSTPNKKGYNTKSAHNYSVMMAGLPDVYKPDIIVIQAIKDYRLEDSSIAKETIIELIKTYAFIRRTFGLIRKTIEKTLDKDTLTGDEAKELISQVNTLISLGESVPDTTKKLKKAITDLELEDNARQQDILRGTDETVPTSANPHTELHA